MSILFILFSTEAFSFFRKKMFYMLLYENNSVGLPEFQTYMSYTVYT